MVGRSSPEIFKREDVMLVLTTAPAGLGHLRVMEALRGGLSEDIRVEVIGLQDPWIQILHRITSRNRLLRAVMEFVQNNPVFEESFTRFYRKRLRKGGKEAYERLSELVKRRRPKPKVLVVVATHHSLAHQVAVVKKRIASDLDLCTVLAVVVTDDSAQNIWGIEGADFIFVPSEVTKNGLLEYMSSFAQTDTRFIVNPYPVSARFCRELTAKEFSWRKKQVAAGGSEKLSIVIPISGAAVQLHYFQELLSVLGKYKRYDITVISRESEYTKKFLRWCEEQSVVRTIAEAIDRDVVLSYEREYMRKVFSIEISKPSEQAFKALISPRDRGGVILLFSEPVGRQESDNIKFLKRHDLLPNVADRLVLDKLFFNNEREGIDEAFLQRSRMWRGIMLPSSGSYAAVAVKRLKEIGILAAMLDFSGFTKHSELRGDGVGRFWNKLARGLEQKCNFLSGS